MQDHGQTDLPHAQICGRELKQRKKYQGVNDDSIHTDGETGLQGSQQFEGKDD
jgi:hypothetical protein